VASLMFIDGVLRSHSGAPIPQGLSLYRTLKEKGQVFLLCANKDRDDRWLKEHKINLVDDLIGTDLPMSGDWVEWRQVEFCRGKGYVELVITSDPELAEKLLSVGITSMMFLHPTYITEKFRPDSRDGRKSWGAIRDEISTQQELFSEDHRVQ
jgi:hypothetical protein